MVLAACLISIAFAMPSMAAPARQLYSHGSPTDLEQLMLEYVNRMRANPAAEAARLGIGLNDGLPPGTISTSPKPPLAFQPALLASARSHSQWMLDFDTFSHTGVSGSQPENRMSKAGFVFSGSWSSGENIAWGGSTGTIDPIAETIARHDSLFKSPGHRTNLCSLSFNHVGLGIKSGIYKEFNGLMATQNFARSGNYAQSLVLGVVFRDADGDGFYDPGEGLPGVDVVQENGSWVAVTSSSGGYAMPYTDTSGSLIITFSGGSLLATESRTIQKTGSNLKIDLLASSAVAPQNPEITVIKPLGGQLTDGKSNINFGAAPLIALPKTRTFIIRNDGTAELSGIAIQLRGAQAKNFVVTLHPMPSLAPKETTEFTISFKPLTKGTRFTSLRIISNDSDENPFDLKLSGKGTAPLQ
jgi:hypothetical protein